MIMAGTNPTGKILQPGDIFCSANPMWLGKAINAAQRFWDVDNRSTYGHAGIIIRADGLTLEALWTVKSQNVFKAYGAVTGKQAKCGLLIGRPPNMTAQKFAAAYVGIKKHVGRYYPFHRLFLHLIPPLSKYVSTGRYLVCSELAAKFLCQLGIMDYYKGVNPDHLADMIKNHKGWKVVYEKAI